MFAGDIYIRNVPIFAHDGKVRNHIHGRNIPGDDAETLLSLAECLDDLFHSSPNHLGSRRFLDELVYLLGGLLGCQWLRNYRHEFNLMIQFMQQRNKL